MVRGWRPYLYGEQAVGQHRDMRSDVCAFEGCERPLRRARDRHNPNKTHPNGRWCPAHYKQIARNGLAGMKPINEVMSKSHKKAAQKRRRNAGK